MYTPITKIDTKNIANKILKPLLEKKELDENLSFKELGGRAEKWTIFWTRMERTFLIRAENWELIAVMYNKSLAEVFDYIYNQVKDR